MTKKKYAALVVGCRTNQYELQLMKTQLEAQGYTPAEEGESADVCVVNTCAVTENAESSSRHAVRSLLHKHPSSKIVVTGCLAQKDPASLLSIAESIHVFSNSEKEKIFDKLFSPEKEVPTRIKTFDNHTRAFVKIQDGCTCFCSYCIVPYLRGPSLSRKKEDILEEIKNLIASSYKEVVITGVNVGDFFHSDCSLTELLVAIDALPGLERVRLSSINPNDIDEKFVDTVPYLKSFCPSLHLVLQSGSNAILKKMRRKYTKEIFRNLVEKFREKNSDFLFSTDVIVGFPGETENDFEETVEMVQHVPFSKVHIFPYSSREGTLAARFQDIVPQHVIRERRTKLASIAGKKGKDIREQFLGKAAWILTERGEDPLWIFGQTPNGLQVKIQRSAHRENELVFIKLVAEGQEELIGEKIV